MILSRSQMFLLYNVIFDVGPTCPKGKKENEKVIESIWNQVTSNRIFVISGCLSKLTFMLGIGCVSSGSLFAVDRLFFALFPMLPVRIAIYFPSVT